MMTSLEKKNFLLKKWKKKKLNNNNNFYTRAHVRFAKNKQKKFKERERENV